MAKKYGRPISTDNSSSWQKNLFSVYTTDETKLGSTRIKPGEFQKFLNF